MMNVILKRFRGNQLVRPRYNILAFINLSLSLINTFLIIKVFGVSDEADLLIIAQLIVAAMTLILDSLTEQFVYYYNNLKKQSVSESSCFYDSVVSWIVIIQFLCVALFLLSHSLIVKVFANDLNPALMPLFERILIINIASFLFIPLTKINNYRFNADEKYSLPYVLQMIPIFLNLLCLVYMFAFTKPDVILYSYSTLLGYLVVLVAQFLVIRSFGSMFKFRLKNKYVKKYFIDSCLIKFGNNIHNFLIQPVISNSLSSLSSGSASLYGYANKMVVALQSLILGPSSNILTTKISLGFGDKDVGAIKRSIKSYIASVCLLFMSLSIVVYICIPLLFSLVFKSILAQDVTVIQNIFLLLVVWQLMATIEGAFNRVILAANKSWIFIMQNSIAIVIIITVSLLLHSKLGVFVIPVSLILGQFVNNIGYINYSLFLMRQMSRMQK